MCVELYLHLPICFHIMVLSEAQSRSSWRGTSLTTDTTLLSPLPDLDHDFLSFPKIHRDNI
jgi:hypothetical protein